ncbi:D-aminoacylase [Pseudomonadales bacterium]|nr:D-aminoacylase [Pseudomonadales bacterium]MDA8949031.1 D-aminoacylase [Pseudomonadales bacterium]
MLDLVIRGADVIDGSGSAGVVTDVGIEGDQITLIGDAGPAHQEIDGTGLVLAPGLIDTHAHDDGAFLRHPDMTFKLSQGVTTVVSGNCGFSAIPFDPESDPRKASGGILSGLNGAFTDLSGYFDAVLAGAPAINNMMLVGHNTIRSLVMDDPKQAPNQRDLKAMSGHVERALEQGACGFSTGLIYHPGRYSQTEEIVALAELAGRTGALYTTHMRNEGDHLLDAVEEALRIGVEAKVHTHISHHKAAGAANWGKVVTSLARIDAAIAAGQRVSLDVYPYTAGSGRMIEYFNLDRINRDLAEVIRIASCPAYREYEGQMLKDIAKAQDVDITDLVRDILTAPRGADTICIQFIIDEQDVEFNLRWRDMMVGSDGIPNLRGKPHPRLYGTFAKILGYYVRERALMSLPEAIRRMTSLPAATFGMTQRGMVRAGFKADLLLFDPATVQDTATYDEPQQLAAGIRTVLVNGKIAWQDGQHQMTGSGQMLKYRAGAYAG